VVGLVRLDVTVGKRAKSAGGIFFLGLRLWYDIQKPRVGSFMERQVWDEPAVVVERCRDGRGVADKPATGLVFHCSRTWSLKEIIQIAPLSEQPTAWRPGPDRDICDNEGRSMTGGEWRRSARGLQVYS